MPWWRISDDVHAHRKIRRAFRRSPESIALWTLAGSYCARYGTDGRITVHEILEVVDGTPKAAVRLASILVDAGLWDRDGDAYVFHDWLDYNDAASDQKARRSADALRKKEARRRCWAEDRDRNESKQMSDGVQPDVQRTSNVSPGGVLAPSQASPLRIQTKS